MNPALGLALGFALCLLLVSATSAFLDGRRIYGLAVAGVAGAILGRLAEGFMPPAVTGWLRAAGIFIAGLALAFDLLTERVDHPRAYSDSQL